VSDIAIELAERIVQRNLDRDTQIALIESYINEVGSER
jgi:F0F1-type ATP synthase membrane subunit b/b'